MNTAKVRDRGSDGFALICWLFQVSIFALLLATAAQAQTFNVVYTFELSDNYFLAPYSGVSIDEAGNLYGTATETGIVPPSIAYKLTHKNGAWIFSYLLPANNETLLEPLSRPVFGPNGTLYGTTAQGSGGCDSGCGNIYNLTPPPTICRAITCYWTANILYAFSEGQRNGGADPQLGDLTFDSAGNIYGTTAGNIIGSDSYSGTVYELSHQDDSWNQTTLLNFYQTSVGQNPASGVTFDSAGNLYGTTTTGGSGNCGAVYELTSSGSGWTPVLLHAFAGADGCEPVGGVIFDHAGNLYGTTLTQGANSGGTVFEMTPSGGGWTFTTLYNFQGSGSACPLFGGSLPSGPTADLVIDSAGNLYGTTCTDGAFGYGAVFKLSPSGGGWTYTSLHDFANESDGASPIGIVSLDSNENLYGTATRGGGTADLGTVWEITP